MCYSLRPLAAVLSVLMASIAFGQTTTPSGFVISSSVTGGGNNATFSVTGADAPAGAGLTDAATFGLNLSSGSDVLLVDVRTIVSSGSLFNVPAAQLGSDVNPPPLPLLAPFPNLAADTYYTTPNLGTAAAGPNVIDTIGTAVTHFDTVDDGPQADFQFGQVTLVADADGVARARVFGTLQTAADPTPIFDEFSFTLLIGESPELPEDILGCTDPTATNFDPFATLDDGSCNFPPPPPPPGPNTFDITLLSNGAGLFFILDLINGGTNILDANDSGLFPDGVTIFAPSDAALDGFPDIDLDVADLIFEPGLSDTDLNALVPDAGDLATLTALNGSAFTLEDGGLTFGGANIIASVQTDNGWVHILDAVPVPEPGSLPLVMVAGLFGLTVVRRRRRLRS